MTSVLTYITVLLTSVGFIIFDIVWIKNSKSTVATMLLSFMLVIWSFLALASISELNELIFGGI